jgi:hypothetical protein
LNKPAHQQQLVIRGHWLEKLVNPATESGGSPFCQMLMPFSGRLPLLLSH